MRKIFILVFMLLFNFFLFYGINKTNEFIKDKDLVIFFNKKEITKEDINKQEELIMIDEYNGEKIEKISLKINKYLEKTSLENYGEVIAKNSSYNSVNPYLVAGIILESTHCKYDCSLLMKQCNNVFSKKGEPGCFGGSYQKYDKLEDSINDLVYTIKNKYPENENQTPNKVYKSFGKNSSWAFRVEKYMNLLKNQKA